MSSSVAVDVGEGSLPFSSFTAEDGTDEPLRLSSSSSSFDKLGLGDETKFLQKDCIESAFLRTDPRLNFGSSFGSRFGLSGSVVV